MRSDLNVPLDNEGNITDAGRILASVPTLKPRCRTPGAKVVVAAHLGRPEGCVRSPSSRWPRWLPHSAPSWAGTSNWPATWSGSDALARAEGLTDGDVLLLENIRFDPQ